MPKDFEIQFETIFINKIIPLDPGIKRLIYWGKKLSLLGLTPNYGFAAAGNLSFRSKNGFIITASKADLGNLTENDFIEVHSCSIDKKEITCTGTIEPSKESMIHCAIYGKRPDVKVIFHVHDDYVINHCDELGLKCTANEATPGSIQLVKEVLTLIGDHDYIVMKNHGIISLGATTEEAGERILEVNTKIKS